MPQDHALDCARYAALRVAHAPGSGFRVETLPDEDRYPPVRCGCRSCRSAWDLRGFPPFEKCPSCHGVIEVTRIE